MFKWYNTRAQATVYVFGTIFGAVQTGNQYDWARVDGDYGPLWFSVPILIMFCYNLVGVSRTILEEVLDNRDKLRLDSSHQPNND